MGVKLGAGFDLHIQGDSLWDAPQLFRVGVKLGAGFDLRYSGGFAVGYAPAVPGGVWCGAVMERCSWCYGFRAMRCGQGSERPLGRNPPKKQH